MLENIGFIGIGVMGRHMARNLLKAGYSLHIFSRTKSKAEELINEGAIWHDNIESLVKKVKIVITMLGGPNDVRNVYFSHGGLLEKTQRKSYLIDMTTSSPLLAKEIHEKAKVKEVYTLDAPVSGGDIGAKMGRLTIMAGGSQNVFNRVFPILQKMGKSITLQGEAGAGQYTKIVNQIIVAQTMLGISEALVYLKKTNLNVEQVMKSIERGSAQSWLLSNYVPRIIEGDFSPGGSIKNFITDLEIALESAKEMSINLPGIFQVYKMYKKLAENGENESGIQSLVKYYDEQLFI